MNKSSIERSSESEISADHVKDKAFQSIKWSLLSTTSIRVIPFLANIALARLLLPQDFGLVAIATLVTAIANLTRDMGLSQALVQRQTDIEDASTLVFWGSTGYSILLYIAIYACSPLIAELFKDPRACDVVRLAGLQVVLGGLGMVQSAYLQRGFRFKEIFWTQLFPALAPALVGIPLAMLGFQYWALVWSLVIGSASSTLILWIISPWRPTFRINLSIAKEMYVFGAWVMLEAICAWVLNYYDNFVVGRVLGTHDLGLYSMGFNVSVILVGFAVAPIAKVAYSSFSRLQDDREKLNQAYLRITTLIAAVSCPTAFGLAATAVPLVKVVFGQQWTGMEVVLAIFAIMPGLAVLWQLNSQVYRALGRPHLMPVFQLVTMIYIFPVYFLAVPHGLVVICLARFSVGILSAPAHVWLLKKILNFPAKIYWNAIKSPFISSLAMGVFVYFGSRYLSPYEDIMGWIKLCGLVIGGGIIYIGLLYMMDRNLVFSFVRIARRAL